METTTLTQSNYVNYDSTFQLQLPLQIETLIPEDDLVYTFVEILKGVDHTKYLPTHVHGNQDCNDLALLKTALFAFVDNKRSLREMEHACKVDIRYMWLSQESRPTFMVFQRFIKNRLTGTVKDIFYDINKHLIEVDNIDMSKLFIDGTKIEAYARKTSFVWKKSILKYQDKLYEKITKAVTEMNKVIRSIDEFTPKVKSNKNMSYTNSCISEYVACHIFHTLGIKTQETMLGMYKNKLAVICKDFTNEYTRLQEFAHLKNTIVDSEQNGYGTELSDILESIEEQQILPSDELKKHFWNMFIADALLGNFDRHNGNWGFLADMKEEKTSIAPVYDCGSCLYPQMDE